MPIRLKRKVAKARVTPQLSQTNKSYRNDSFAGGIYDVAGNTATLSNSTDLERLEKDLFGLFEISDNPNYYVVQGDILGHAEVRIVEPVFAYKDLIKLYYSSTILQQCVDSMVTNIESYGVDLEYIGEEGKEDTRAAQNEKTRIKRILNTLTSDGRSIQEHRAASRVDKEVFGSRHFEVIRDAAGRVVSFDHISTSTLRVTTREKSITVVPFYDTETGTFKELRRRFRRFVQIADDGRKTWFKEYGDPRSIDPSTGKVNDELEIEDEATEIYADFRYTPGTPYGIPRWSGAIPSLLGSREAEMVNLNFFRDNAIPAMAVMVSGGALTEESFEKINQYIAGVRGAASMNRIVVLEAMTDGAEAAAIDGSQPAPRITMEPLLSERQHEGLFAGYINEAERKTRSAFRLPPIYIGSAQDYNRASAFASVLTADQQIFIPERLAWDDLFERVVLSTHKIKFWRVKSSGPGLQDPAEVARIVNSLGREGALTANIAIKLANRYLDADIRPVMDDWGNMPFSIVMQHVKEGKVYAGLDDFEEVINENLPEEEDDELDMRDANVPLVKMSRRLLNAISNTMDDKLQEALQSIADTHAGNEFQ